MIVCVRKKAFGKDRKILTLNKDNQQRAQCSGALAPMF